MPIKEVLIGPRNSKEVRRQTKSNRVFFTLIIVLLPMSIAAKTRDRSIKNRVLAVAHRMASAFERVEDYACDVETIFHQGGEHGIRYGHFRFKLDFKRNKKIRVDFAEPFPGTIVIYNFSQRPLPHQSGNVGEISDRHFKEALAAPRN